MDASEIVKDRAFYRANISSALDKSVEGFIEAGRWLIEAKKKLVHGQFLPMVEDDLKLSRSLSSMLMRIAEHRVISNVDHGKHLPSSWRTLYELTKVPDEILIKRLEDGTINSAMTRKDVAKLIPARPAPKTPKPKPEPIILSDDDEDSSEQSWQQSIEDVVEAVSDLTSRYPDWRMHEVPLGLVERVDEAVKELAKLADELRTKVAVAA